MLMKQVAFSIKDILQFNSKIAKFANHLATACNTCRVVIYTPSKVVIVSSKLCRKFNDEFPWRLLIVKIYLYNYISPHTRSIQPKHLLYHHGSRADIARAFNKGSLCHNPLLRYIQRYYELDVKFEPFDLYCHGWIYKFDARMRFPTFYTCVLWSPFSFSLQLVCTYFRCFLNVFSFYFNFFSIFLKSRV